jgi:hypothetical protein
MKKLLILLFSLFFLSSPSVYADDISDFEIEGMSIGDSLLDYMTEDEILAEIEISISANDNHYLREPLKYLDIYLKKDFQVYKDGMSFIIKNNITNKYISNSNEKFNILLIRGKIKYVEDFDGCIQKRDEIVKMLNKMFPNLKKKEAIFPHPTDSSGNSKIDGVYFYFDSGGDISTWCTDYEETFRVKNNFSEGFNIAITSAEVINWLEDY